MCFGAQCGPTLGNFRGERGMAVALLTIAAPCPRGVLPARQASPADHPWST